MAGIDGGDRKALEEMMGIDGGDGKGRESECLFVWDDASNLYFHASSGFYHDPNAGWYYSSRDGLYYTFDNGTYVPLTFDKGEESEPQECTTLVCSEPDEINQCNEEQSACDGLEDHCPPSEWLEETLIDIYLSGHSNFAVASLQSSEKQSQDTFEGLAVDAASDKLPASHQVEKVGEEWISEDVQDAETLTDRCSEEASLEEEKWQAQYGQVVRTADVPAFPVIDIWDWELVGETFKKRQQVTRLLGRLIRPSSKLHPSVPSGGGRFKTASIRDVHLDLVRVASGKVYRLRTPNKRYLAALSAYDSSNPTRDWSFPYFLESMQNIELNCLNGPRGIKRPNAESSGIDVAPAFQKDNNIPYRDRAAERRSLHGEHGFGPGQKNFLITNLHEEESTSQTSDPEGAAAEALNMTFGKGSYARKLLERMGWAAGEGLGSSTKGILEPLQAVANKGNAGLGWSNVR